jgi:ankyrin repeat protein
MSIEKETIENDKYEDWQLMTLPEYEVQEILIKEILGDTDIDYFNKIVSYSTFNPDSPIEHYEGKSIFMIACCNNKIELLDILLDTLNFDINFQDYAGWTALLESIYYGNIDVTKKLLNLPNIDTSKVTNSGANCLIMSQLSESSESWEAFEIFLNHPDTDVNYSKDENITPLMLACVLNNVEMIKALLAHPKINKKIKRKSNKVKETAWDMASDEIKRLVPELKP